MDSKHNEQSFKNLNYCIINVEISSLIYVRKITFILLSFVYFLSSFLHKIKTILFIFHGMIIVL